MQVRWIETDHKTHWNLRVGTLVVANEDVGVVKTGKGLEIVKANKLQPYTASVITW
jgi:hypothetical protein